MNKMIRIWSLPEHKGNWPRKPQRPERDTTLRPFPRKHTQPSDTNTREHKIKPLNAADTKPKELNINNNNKNKIQTLLH